MNQLLKFYKKPESVRYHVKPYWSQRQKEKLVIMIGVYFKIPSVVNHGVFIYRSILCLKILHQNMLHLYY